MTVEGRRIPYQPALDGLRALAVGLVLLFHHFQAVRGGFLGVDVFFVLSGYLITSLLVTEHAATGRVDLPEFWRRRARRLLPAVFVLMVMVSALSAWVLTDGHRALVRWDAIAALFYVENWYRIGHQLPTYPLGHMWSLSIEEQWYLVWPVALLALLRLARGQLARVVVVVAGAALASATAMSVLYGSGDGQPRAYLGTDTRVQGLLVGAGLALLLARRTEMVDRRTSLGLELLGLTAAGFLAVLVARARIHDEFLFRGGFLAVALAVAAVIVAATRSELGWLRRALSVKPLVLVGLVSYGLYLYHLPVYGWLTPRATDLDRWPLFALRIAVTTALAVASYFVIERPVRTGALRRFRPVAITALAAAAVVAMLLVTTRSTPLTREQGVLAFAMGVAAQGAPDDATRVAVVGDSTALSLSDATGVVDTDELRGVAWGRLGCPLAPGSPVVDGTAVPIAERCRNWPRMFEIVGDYFDTDVSVLFAGSSEAYDWILEDRTLALGSPEHDRLMTRQLSRAYDKLTGRGSRFVLALPATCGIDPVRAEAVGTIRALWERWAAEQDQQVVDLDDLLCPGGTPARTAAGTPILEHGAFTPAGGTAAWEWLAREVT